MANVISRGDVLLAQVQSLTLSLTNPKTIDTENCVISCGKDSDHCRTLLNAIWIVPNTIVKEDLSRFASGEINEAIFVCVPEKTVLCDSGRVVAEIEPGYWQVIRRRAHAMSPHARKTVD